MIMAYIKRWTAAVASRVDTVVARIENHEALVDSALRDLKHGTAKAHVRLDRVRKDRRVLERELQEAQRAEALWRERAVRTTDDEARALECLKRSKQATKRAADRAARLEEHTRVEAELARDLGKLRDRVSVLRDQRDMLRARESRADAMRVASDVSASASGELEDIFDRWEIRIREAEYAGGCIDPVDGLEEEYESEELQSELKAELAALREEA
jgi:phage shock protein A